MGLVVGDGHRSPKLLISWVLCVSVLGGLLTGAGATESTIRSNPGLKDPRKAARLHAALQKGAAQTGIASWYGGKFHGRRTANGELFDQHGTSAAHKTLPFGTLIEVRNLDNQRTVQVRVNDRGPFVRKRILDLSYGAAQQIGLVGSGIAPIELTLVSWPGGPTMRKPKGSSQGPIFVQAGAFRDLDRARALAASLKGIEENFQVYSVGEWHRVRAPMENEKKARKLIKKLEKANIDAVLLGQ